MKQRIIRKDDWRYRLYRWTQIQKGLPVNNSVDACTLRRIVLWDALLTWLIHSCWLQGLIRPISMILLGISIYPIVFILDTSIAIKSFLIVYIGLSLILTSIAIRSVEDRNEIEVRQNFWMLTLNIVVSFIALPVVVIETLLKLYKHTPPKIKTSFNKIVKYVLNGFVILLIVAAICWFILIVILAILYPIQFLIAIGIFMLLIIAMNVFFDKSVNSNKKSRHIINAPINFGQGIFTFFSDIYQSIKYKICPIYNVLEEDDKDS